MSQFKIYSSSAGSGKTYTLTQAYLKLVLAQPKPSYIRSILAITFTNDAANEMKTRILDALKDFISEGFNENSKFWAMFRAISDEINENEPVADQELQKRAAAVFHQIIHEYADFSVKTIDSFVNQIVSAFTDDLKLPFNYEIVLDRDTVMVEAIERLFTKAGDEQHKDITRMLESFALEKADDGKSWNTMPADLAEFSNDILKDQHFSLIAKLEDLTISDYREIQGKIKGFLKWLEKSIKERSVEAQRLLESENITIDDFSYGARGGFGSFVYGLEKDVMKEYKSYAKAAMENDKFFAAKAPKPIVERFESIKTDVKRLINEILEIREKYVPKYTLLTAINSQMHKLALLKKVKQEFDAVLAENNQVYLAEFNRMILEIVLNEPVPFIYERLGEKFNHILIDEFQDTSDMQFYNLLPLIENSLAANNFNLVVGDAKQSIYRWRGGKMELIVHLFNKNIGQLLNNPLLSVFQQDQLATVNQYLSPVSLAINYRSASEIVAFNNDFFRRVLANKAAKFPFLSDAYQTFEQLQRPNAPTGAHIEIAIIPKENRDELMLDCITATIEKVLAEGYELSDVAVLCRKTKESSSIAKHLNEHNYQVISQDSLLLNHSGAIRLTVAFLRVIDQPDNQLAKYEAAYLFFQFKLRKVPDVNANALISAAVEADDVNEFYRFFAERGYEFDAFKLQKSGIFAISEQIIRTLNLFEQTHELPYLFGFLDIALEFGNRQSNHLHDFLLYWEDKKDKKSIATTAETNAVTITTIHRSKGLEYPIVIVPYANWTTDFRNNSSIWVDLEAIDYEEFTAEKSGTYRRLGAASVIANKTLLETEVHNQYEAENEALFIENLNMLYVAFTRPTDKLFLFPARNGFNGFSGVAKLIEEYLVEIGQPPLPSKEADEVERMVINEGKSLKKIKEKPVISTLKLSKIISEDRGDRLRLRRTSEKIFDPETLEKNKDRGNKVHAAFALIRSHKDIDEAIRQLTFQGVITATEAAEIKESIERVIELPALKPLFAESIEVINEKDILVKNGEVLRPDRVVFTTNGVHILDFKTGVAKESHQQQIRRYGSLYKQMGYTNVETLLVYLDNNEVLKAS